MWRSMSGQAFVVSMVAAALLGCAKKPPETRGAASETPTVSSQAHSATSSGGAAAPAEGEVQLAGLLGCGHCVFHVTGECAACVKTAEGKLYVIDGVPEGSALWEGRLEEGHQIVVTGAVLGSTEDKLQHIAMTSFELKSKDGS